LGVAVAFELDSEVVGTVRAVPIGYGLTLVEELRSHLRAQPGDSYVRGWEMGRLVISPEYRGGPESLRGFLYLSLSFLNGLSPVGHLHAACTPALARLYRRFGLDTVAKDVPLPGTGKTYTLIHGPFTRVIAALSHAEEMPAWSPMMMNRAFGTHGNRGALA
jgi:hypothetical protein